MVGVLSLTHFYLTCPITFSARRLPNKKFSVSISHKKENSYKADYVSRLVIKRGSDPEQRREYAGNVGKNYKEEKSTLCLLSWCPGNVF